MENLEPLLSSFENRLDMIITQVWAPEDFPEHLSQLANSLNRISGDIVDIGNFCYEGLQNQGTDLNQANFLFYRINFSWAEQAKSFLILWRDVLFEQQKALVLKIDGKVQASDLNNLKKQSEATIQAAAAELLADLRQKAGQHKVVEKQIELWRLQQNPWPVYREQMEELPKQAEQLLQQYAQLSEFSEGFHRIKALIEQTLGIVRENIDNNREVAQKTIDFVGEHFDEKPGRIGTYIENAEQEIESSREQSAFSLKLEKEVALFEEKMQVPVATIDGLIQVKDIPFRRSIRQWLESEILPVLYEVWELSDQANNSLKMALLNIRNRDILMANEQKEGLPPSLAQADICQPLNTYLAKLKDWEKNLADFGQLLTDRINRSFHIAAVYDRHQQFLPIPLQSTINQLKLNQNQFIARIQALGAKQISRFQRLKISVEREEALSDSEKIVRFIQSRTADRENKHYTSIFQTKGYIGESFWVGRQAELRRVKTLIDHWNNGFRGAILLTGQRFCGKSLFGEVMANRHFLENTIRLSPNTSIKIQGRILNTSYDLGEALEFVEKYTLNIRPLVWIDDFELWRDVNTPLSSNVRKLQKHIDRFSGHSFYMVSMSNWLKAHLDKIHEISKAFQAEINLDRMSMADIKQSIIIRHGATHKNLVDAERKEVLRPNVFRKLIKKTHRASRGNIGEALNRWSYAIRKLDEDRVVYRSPIAYTLPDFITPETGLLLRTVMMEKRINEYRLRKRFGALFKDKYGGTLQRLISVGLLNRQLDGWLELREGIANDIGRLLEENDYLRFY